MRILHAVTAPETARAFLAGQLSDLVDKGHDVHLVCSPGEALASIDPRVRIHAVAMRREPQAWRDALALMRLVRLLRRVRPEVTVVSTPKAGLLVGLAAALAGVPRRFYLQRGLRLEGSAGATRLLLTALEVVSCRAAHHVVAVSPSLADELRELRAVSSERVSVLGSGSSNGVDCERFRPPTLEARTAARESVGARPDTVVIGFVGRLTADKGLEDLLTVAGGVGRRADVTLVVVGDFENISLRRQYEARLAASRVHVTGFVSDTGPWYGAMDVLVLPTRREGFPNVVLEAAASGLPVVTTDATGARDSVIDGITGLVVPRGDPEALDTALRRLVDDPGLRADMGAAARARVVHEFNQRVVWDRYARLWTTG